MPMSEERYDSREAAGSAQASGNPVLSLLVPCYNEEAALPALYSRVTEAAAAWELSYEVVVVDDGSTDASWELLQGMAERDRRWRALRLSRNFGHQAALSVALFHARGECAVLIDADLQDPPEEVGRFLEKWREGYQVVYAIRTKRKESLWKRGCYRLYYLLLAKAANIRIPLDSGDFCLMDRRIIDLLNKMPEQNRFIRGVRAWVGFRQIGLEYERDPRSAGESKYSFGKLLQLALDGIFSFSSVPLRMVSYLGCTIALISGLFGLFAWCRNLFPEATASLGMAPASPAGGIVAAICFMGALQLIGIGILGEYLGRIYEQAKGRPLWIVSEACGLDHYQESPGAEIPVRVRDELPEGRAGEGSGGL